LSLYLLLPKKKAYINFENAWEKTKKAMVKRCDTHLSTLEGVRVFLQIKMIPRISVRADGFFSTWMGIMTKKGEKDVGNFLESKSGSPEKDGWLRFALFGKDMTDPFGSDEETAMLLTYLASKHTRTRAIDFVWGILAVTRESLFQTALATTDSMLELFKIRTSTLLNRLPSPETLVPNPVPLYSTSKDTSSASSSSSSSQSNLYQSHIRGWRSQDGRCRSQVKGWRSQVDRCRSQVRC
jgi:hypothetical protein